MIDRARRRRVQLRFRRQRREAEHLEKLLPELRLARVPVRKRLHIRQRAIGHGAGLGAKILGENLVPRRRVRQRLPVGRGLRGAKSGREDNGEEQAGKRRIHAVNSLRLGSNGNSNPRCEGTKTR